MKQHRKSRRIALHLAVVLLALSPAAVEAQVPATDDRATQLAQQAFNNVGRNPAEALRLGQLADQAYHAVHDPHGREHYCFTTPAERDALMTQLQFTRNGGNSQPAELIGDGWCFTNFVIGFSLIDLHRQEEALPWLQRAVSMQPFNAQFINELAEWQKSHRRFDEAYDLFERATTAAPYADEASRGPFMARGLRGMGFVLIERGQLDQAEALFNRSLEFEPNSPAARNELAYIASQRQRAPRSN